MGVSLIWVRMKYSRMLLHSLISDINPPIGISWSMCPGVVQYLFQGLLSALILKIWRAQLISNWSQAVHLELIIPKASQVGSTVVWAQCEPIGSLPSELLFFPYFNIRRCGQFCRDAAKSKHLKETTAS